MSAILQKHLPYAVNGHRALPGAAPLDPAEWLVVDEAFGAQMAERARLLTVTTGAGPATDELLHHVLDWLAAHSAGYEIAADSVRRPDGLRVMVDRADPMGTLGHLVQEDLCLMERRGGEHVLTAAILCFPASWSLADKIGRPLTTIHVPVPNYDAGLARRVQRLFDGVQVGRPLWRFNCNRPIVTAVILP